MSDNEKLIKKIIRTKKSIELKLPQYPVPHLSELADLQEETLQQILRIAEKDLAGVDALRGITTTRKMRRSRGNYKQREN